MSSQATSDFRRNRKKNLISVCGGKCNICGYNKSIAALQFHHIHHEQKLYSISSNGTCHNIEKDLIQIKKCLLVCANCHREIHAGMYDNIDLLNFQYYDEAKAQNLLEQTKNKLQTPQRFCSVCGKPITKYSNSGKCSICVRANTNMPSREELKELIYHDSFQQIGRKYLVSGNTIKKWCQKYGLPSLKKDIKLIDESHWRQI